MAADVNLNPGNEPDLHLLLTDTFVPLWKSLFQGLGEFFFPIKLPPLNLESNPIPVRDIWGFYSYKKNGALGSTAAHILVLGLILGITLRIPRPLPATPKPNIDKWIVFSDFPLKPAKTQSHGGGGGGDQDPLQASVGRLPKPSMLQITPPAAVIRNPTPRLAVEPTVIVPTDVTLARNRKMPNLGDPNSPAAVPSNGPGSNSGIGPGANGGDGPGDGRGVGPGKEAGRGGGDTFRFGGKGVTAPRVTYQTDPEFSEEARKAKYQGNCVLGLVVDANGRPTNIHVLNSLGMGLDEKAIESVKNWKFDPGKKDGHDVAVEIAVEVDFHLY